MKTDSSIPSVFANQPLFNAVRLQGKIPPKPSFGSQVGAIADDTPQIDLFGHEAEFEHKKRPGSDANFKNDLYNRLRQLPGVLVLRHGNENSSVFTVYIPANDLKTEYSVYDIEKEIYQKYNEARFEVIVEEAPIVAPSDTSPVLRFGSR